MSDRNREKERLIKLIRQAKKQESFETLFANDIDTAIDMPHGEEYLANYLLANGVIVPPCKVGDKIYMLVTRKTTSFEYPNGKMKRIENQHTFIKETYLTKLNFFKVLDDFGKTVFLTKEEAEEKLKELGK